MNKRFALALSTALSTFPVYANADVTGAEVWESMKELIELSPGSTLTVGNREQSGDTLTLTDITVVTVIDTESDADSSIKRSSTMNMAVTMDSMSFRDLGDGTVEVSMPPLITYKSIGSDTVDYGSGPSTNEFNIAFEVLNQNYKAIAKGTADDLDFDYTADEVTIRLTSADIPDFQVAGANELIMRNLSGTYAVQPGDVVETQQTLNAESFILAMNLNVEGDDGVMNYKYDVTDIKVAFNGAFPVVLFKDGAPEPKPEEVFGPSIVDLSMEFGQQEIIQTMNIEGMEIDMEGTADSGNFRALLNKDEVRYSASVNNYVVSASAPAAFPFPLDFAMNKMLVDFGMPLSKSEGPKDAGTEIRFEELVLPEIAWSMADPSGQLDHSPVTVVADIDMQVQLDHDLMSEEAFDSPNFPGKIFAAKLAELDIRAAGATVSGTGDLTFDNDDMTTFDGFPAPVGTISLQGTGINGLIDNLISMGLVPEDQAMMGRMMLGMFTQSTGDDALESVIEFAPGGEISANGQRIR